MNKCAVVLGIAWVMGVGCQREPEDAGASIGGQGGRETSTNAVSEAGGLNPGQIVKPAEQYGLQGQWRNGSALRDVNLAERVRLALTIPTAGASGVISRQVVADPLLDGVAPPTVDDLKVNVSNGVVTLNGFVDTDMAKTNVTSRIRQLTGVSNVVNRLRVRQPEAAGALKDE